MGHKNVTVFKPVNELVGLWCLTPLSTIFMLIVAVSFIGGGNGDSNQPVASN